MTKRKTAQGLTLIELMIVVAIIAILATVGYPAYTQYLLKSRRADAKAMMLEMIQRQQRFKTENMAYTADLTQLGYTAANDVPTSKGHYLITAIGCGTGLAQCVQLTATAQGSQASDGGPLTLDSIGNKGPADKW